MKGYILQFFAYGYAVARQPEGISYTLYDSALVQHKEKEGVYNQQAPGWHPHDTWVANIPLPGLERELNKPNDRVKVADSWDDLAQWMGIDPAALKTTIDEYNAGLRSRSRPNLRQSPQVPAASAHAPLLCARGSRDDRRHHRRHQDQREDGGHRHRGQGDPGALRGGCHHRRMGGRRHTITTSPGTSSALLSIRAASPVRARSATYRAVVREAGLRREDRTMELTYDNMVAFMQDYFPVYSDYGQDPATVAPHEGLLRA